MLYHLVLLARTCAYAHSLFEALSARYQAVYPALAPLAYGQTSRDQGFVVAAWHGGLDEQALACLRNDPRVLDLCSYAMPFFSPGDDQEETEDEKRSRLFGPAHAFEGEGER